MSLEPIAPDTAVELYLADRENELSEASLYAHEKQLQKFVDWCEDEDIDNLNTLTGRTLQEFRLWRREDGDLAPPSEKSQMDTLRVFVRWLESVDGVEQDLAEKVVSPSLRKGQHVRDVMLESDRATEVLDYLRQYCYASREHVTIALMWHTMMRTGGVRALDVSDYHSDEQYLSIVHRPETRTPIKNKERGERLVALSNQVCDVLDGWLAHQRPDVEDDAGRKPLVATTQGRAHASTLRDYVYRYTRPCMYGEDCPHDRSPDECEATSSKTAAKCPSSVSPHAIRRGSITHALAEEVPETAIEDRANVSQEVLDYHYDRRTAREKMEQRRDYLDNI